MRIRFSEGLLWCPSFTKVGALIAFFPRGESREDLQVTHDADCNQWDLRRREDALIFFTRVGSIHWTAFELMQSSVGWSKPLLNMVVLNHSCRFSWVPTPGRIVFFTFADEAPSLPGTWKSHQWGVEARLNSANIPYFATNPITWVVASALHKNDSWKSFNRTSLYFSSSLICLLSSCC